MSVEIVVNGVTHRLEGAPEWASLLSVLRDDLGLYGTKNACEQGECGSCSVLLDGDLVCACLVMVSQAGGREIRTVEGLQDDSVACSIRDHLIEAGGVQCGFCTPGFVVAATALLKRDPSASTQCIKEGLSGNLCRCTGYTKILEAVSDARDDLASEGGR